MVHVTDGWEYWPPAIDRPEWGSHVMAHVMNGLGTGARVMVHVIEGRGAGGAGKPVADLLYQVIATSGSFDPTSQKLILEGVVGVITALKIDPSTSAKFARRSAPSAKAPRLCRLPRLGNSVDFLRVNPPSNQGAGLNTSLL